MYWAPGWPKIPSIDPRTWAACVVVVVAVLLPLQPHKLRRNAPTQSRRIKMENCLRRLIKVFRRENDAKS